MKVKIKGKVWTVSFLPRKAYYSKYPNHCHTAALTVYNHDHAIREINFCGRPSFSTIKHEVMHAFLSTRNFSGVSYGEIEEQVCDEVGYNLERIQKVSNSIYNEVFRSTLALRRFLDIE